MCQHYSVYYCYHSRDGKTEALSDAREEMEKIRNTANQLQKDKREL